VIPYLVAAPVAVVTVRFGWVNYRNHFNGEWVRLAQQHEREVNHAQDRQQDR
jgi:hypothetical protein